MSKKILHTRLLGFDVDNMTNHLSEHAHNTQSNSASWLFLLPLSSKSVVLDFGFDSVSTLLSMKCDHVFVLETCIDHTSDSEAVMSNIRLVIGDVFASPFTPASFDVAIIDKPFIHDSISRAKGNSAETRETNLLDVLLEIRRLLKPNGHLCMVIKNRYCRKSTILMIKDKLTRSTFGYSVHSFQKLLKRSGFEEIRIYGVLPSYDNPWYVMSYRNQAAFKYFLENNLLPISLKTRAMRAIGKIALLLRLHEYLFPSPLITAKKVGAL